ncbi:MAG: EamA family transporter [Bacteroidetes bacterium 4572_77]|nr:MAG: EamA family transporter [Bacteroidetes bacterium 4572_77]
MSNQAKGLLFASITALFWGFLAIAVKIATQYVPVVNIVWFRFAFAFSVLFVWFLKADRQKLKILLNPPLLLLIAALALAFNYYGFTKGVHHTDPNTAQVVIQFGPILLGMIGFLFFKEKITLFQSSGFVVALLGLSLFYYHQVSQILETEKDVFNLGFFWVAAAAIAWLTYAALQKLLVKSYDSQQLNLVIFGLPALLYLPFVSLAGFSDLSINLWLLLVFLGANTIIAYGCLSLAFKYTDVNKVSVIITLNPIITFVIMSILYQMQVDWIETQKMNTFTWMGALLVILGAFMVVFFKKPLKKI